MKRLIALLVLFAGSMVGASVWAADALIQTSVTTNTTAGSTLVYSGGKSAQAIWISNPSATSDLWLSAVSITNAGTVNSRNNCQFTVAAGGGSITFPSSTYPFKPNQLYGLTTNGTASVITTVIVNP